MGFFTSTSWVPDQSSRRVSARIAEQKREADRKAADAERRANPKSKADKNAKRR